MKRNTNKEPIAIVGMSCRLPGGGNTLDEFWDNLIAGKDTVVPVPADRWSTKKFYDPDPDKPGKMYMREGAFLDTDIAAFDALFFGLSPREAQILDPQQRLALELTIEAADDAGIRLEDLSDSDTGVFMGGFFMDHLSLHTHYLNRREISSVSSTAVSCTLLSNRISYSLNLKGPSITIDTACSSSLVATHYACNSLWNNECRIVIAGGISLMINPTTAITLSKGRFLSTHGRSMSFDHRGNGYGRGEGGGIVFLKRLSEAEADGDKIYAVIKNTGVNQDGRTAGITLPNPASQKSLIEKVYAEADVDYADVQYIEAHGTGTRAGDSTELSVLHDLMSQRHTDATAKEKVFVGSVKSHIGHLEAAAGIAGLIKTTLSLQNSVIPHNINFEEGNSEIDFDDLAVQVPLKNRGWPECDIPRASINSFGFGGTNAHVIIEKYEPATTPKIQKPESTINWPILFPLSARSESALKKGAAMMADRIASADDFNDVYYSLRYRRSHYSKRLAIYAESLHDLQLKLRHYAGDELSPYIVSGDCEESLKTAFVYTGMGPQWWAMGRELMETQPVFRNALEVCDAAFKPVSGWSLIEELSRNEETSNITQTDITQPTNFAIQYALTAYWQSLGVEPDVIVGHSLGEVAAAHAAGALNLEDALKVIYHRGRLQQRTDGDGGMLAVGLSESDIAGYIAPYGERLCIGAINSPGAVTLSGDLDAIARLAETLEDEGIFHRKLQVKTGFHSFVMDDLETELLESLQDIQTANTTKPLYSSISGKREDGHQFNTAYWWKNVRHPVSFAQSTIAMIKDGTNAFVEIGPHPVLGTSIKQCLQSEQKRGHTVSSLVRKKPEHENLLLSLGQLYCAGYDIDWSTFGGNNGKLTDLPMYCWDKEIYWGEDPYTREDRLGNTEHPVFALDLRLPHPAWEVDFSLNYFPWLSDHKIEGLILNPGAAYIEAGLMLSKKIFGDKPCILEDVQFTTPLIYREKDSQRIQIHYRHESQRFSIYSQNHQTNHSWTYHAGARMKAYQGVFSDIKHDIEALKNRLGNPFNVDIFYTMLANVGLQYGPAFQGIQEIYIGHDEVLVKIKTPAGLLGEDYYLHPCQLDPCFQTLAILQIDSERPYLPTALEQLIINASPQEAFWCHLTITTRTERELKADFDIFNTDGIPLVQVKGIICREVPAMQSTDEKYGGNLYEMVWREEQNHTSRKQDSINAMVFLRHNQKDIAKAWRAQDPGCIQVFWGDDYNVLGNNNYALNPREKQHWERLWQDLSGFEFSAMVYLWHLGADTPVGSYESGDIFLLSLFSMSREDILRRPFKIGLAVSHANHVVPADKCEGLGLSTLWGIKRVLMSEIVSKRCKSVDFDRANNLDASEINVLIKEFLSEDVESEIAYRDGKRYVHRLERVEEKSLQPQDQLAEKTLESPLSYNPRSNVFNKTPALNAQPNQCIVRVISYYISDTIKQMVDLSSGKGQWEGWGEIIAASNDTGFKPGDKVSFLALDQNLATFMAVDKKWLIPCESQQTWAPLSLLLPVYTAFDALHLDKTQSILIAGQNSETGKLVRTLLDHQGLSFDVLDADNPQQESYDILMDCDDASLAFTAYHNIKHYGKLLKLGENTAYDEVLWKVLSERNITYLSSNTKGLNKSQSSGVLLRAKTLMEQSPVQFDYESSLTRYTHNQLPDIFEALNSEQSIASGLLTFSADTTVKANIPYIEKPLFIPDASYLITGGTRGLGLELAKWAATQGARHLILLSLRGLTSDYATEAVKEIEANGCQVKVLAVDIADGAALNEAYHAISADIPALKGVIHGAMVLDDDFLQSLSPERMEKVLSPKVRGAWNLHQLTLEIPLAFFFSFSSVSSLIGNPGQANYVAANCFLDIFSHYRQGLGLPATTINLGVVSDSGIVSEHKEVEDFFANAGFSGIKPVQVGEFLQFAYQTSPAQIAYFDLDWAKWNAILPTDWIPPMYEDIMSNARGGNSDALLQTKARIKDLTEEEQQDFFKELVRDELSELLKMPAEKIELHTRIVDIGVNSLMAVEFSGAMGEKHGLMMPILDIMSGATVEQAALLTLNHIRDN